jgi:hypothetical protein
MMMWILGTDFAVTIYHETVYAIEESLYLYGFKRNFLELETLCCTSNGYHDNLTLHEG